MFMENLERPVPRALVMSLWETYIPDAKQLQLIDVDDIGAFVAGVFGDPDRYIGQTVTLAGDSLTRPKAVAALKRGGRPALFSVRLPGLTCAGFPQRSPSCSRGWERSASTPTCLPCGR